MIHQTFAMTILSIVLAMVSGANDANTSTAATPTKPLAIEQGKIRGLVVGDIHAYKGIPYAAPPVGELRWRPPQPARGWEGVRDCFAFGPGCPQRISPIMAAVPLASVAKLSEDCLTLNVFRPADDAKAKRPVMVWIHGGGYTEGASCQGLYDGAALARRGVVVVTINYRLGPFGFWAHPALSRESPANASGNFGLMDQIEALRWVQKNVAAFGGDPDRVTIFGESAGGGSVLCLLVSPQAKGLFHRAISQSAPEMTLPRLRESFLGRESGEDLGRRLVAQCGVSDHADTGAMRRIPVETLVRVSPSLEVVNREPDIDSLYLPLGPIVDNHVIPEDPNDAIAHGRAHRVPLLIGNTRDEFTLFLLFAKVPKDKSAYEKAIRAGFGEAADRVLERYPAGASAKEIRAVSVRLLTDYVYGAQTRHAALNAVATGQPTFRYVFSRESTFLMPGVARAHHGCEIPYVFGVELPLKHDWDKRLAEATQRYWVNFATTGDPNGPGLPPWPGFDSPSKPTLELGDSIEVRPNYREDELRLLSEILRSKSRTANGGG